MVSPPQHARRMEGFLVRPEGPPLLFHREGQHRVSHDHLAGDPARLRCEARPAVRRAGHAIPELLRREDERGPRARRVALRHTRAVISGATEVYVGTTDTV